MFEHAMLAGSPKGKRVWTTCAGVTGQMVLVAGMAVAPMIWPEAMPPAVFTMLAPTAPQGPAPKAKAEPKPQAPAAPVRKKVPAATAGLVQPTGVPPEIKVVTDTPVNVIGNVGGRGNGVEGGLGTGNEAGPVGDIVRAGQEAGRKEPPRAAATVNPPAIATPRVRIGGLVQEPRLVYRVEPRYPQLALMSRIEGVVKLSGVIAIDGHIAELAIENGNPLLAPAALVAVRQWRYEPTQLDGVPVEVVTSIVVTFRLSR